MSRLTRLSARAYGRLKPEEQKAVDLLEFGRPDAAERGRCKTLLGWRRTREETEAYAAALLAAGMVPVAVANRLRILDDYLQRVTDARKPARNRSAQAAQPGLTDRAK